MINRWIDSEAEKTVKDVSHACEKDLALTLYISRLVGSEPDLVLFSGGNTSMKTSVRTLVNDDVPALFVKASGVALERITPDGFICLDLDRIKKLRRLESLDDATMSDELRMRLLRPAGALPSIETLMHAFLDARYIVHTHPNAILCLTNRGDAETTCKRAFDESVAVIPYANAGLAFGKAVAEAVDTRPNGNAVVIMHHGLVTWGPDPKQAYSRTIEIVSNAERFIEQSRQRRIVFDIKQASLDVARDRYCAIAPILRGLISPPSSDPDAPYTKMHLTPLINEETLGILDLTDGREFAETSPLTPDYLVRTKSYSLFMNAPDFTNMETLKTKFAEAINDFSSRYDSYRRRYASRLPDFDPASTDLLPKVIMIPGVGAVCIGQDIENAAIVKDITEQALRIKRTIRETGGSYRGLTEDHLFDMEFRSIQRAKVNVGGGAPLKGSIAIVTGAAGAIGSGICDELLAAGCAVAVTDLPGDRLDETVGALRKKETRIFNNNDSSRVFGVALDVIDPESIKRAFDAVVSRFGGVDLLVINAGLAHVSPLIEMNLDAFKKLERVNIEGTLNLLAEAGRRLKLQGMGGDIVLVSTKNVFAPGAGFGAYSATKAAAHQLCRIASLEFALFNVRVNMVAPDAVFSHGAKKSGLWAEVGPGRMKARGLDEKGLEEYYRNRNLLRASVTAEHVAKAVLFFATRQTPTTGATIPVDGGLPDSTPR
jgi:rhamnose utilization protein RhaD (predicted bifunctional aldolase and dehydrogenase)/NAD(P)-dependent dehydrogenase (short-subunit alcohol dehydrogenase family)